MLMRVSNWKKHRHSLQDSSPYLQLPFHRSWSISQSLEHLEGISGMINPVPSRLHPSSLGPTRSSPVAHSHPAMQDPNGTPQHIAGYPNPAAADTQQMANFGEVHQQPSSPFSHDNASHNKNSRERNGQQEQSQHDRSPQGSHQQHGNQQQHARSPLGFQRSSVNPPLELIPERSERDSAMSIEFAGQGYGHLGMDAFKGRPNNTDNLLHNPPSMQWQQ